jgi:ferredoxin-NADP reductase/Na+-translocating ferredoxin:NAD+ oxidoreductase RnfD subunit
MYRTVTLALVFLAFCSVTLGFWRLVPYTGFEQLISLSVALLVAFGVNVGCSKIRKISANHESALITALIIFFLILPAQLGDSADLLLIAAAVALAMISKYVIVWRGQHIVNPAAFGVFALALFYGIFPDLGYFESSWWIGRPELLLPLLLAGGAVVYKIRKWPVVLSFLGVAFLVYLYEEWNFFEEIAQPEAFWLSGPSLFLAFFMLTEPFTMPPTKRWQVAYGGLVGVISQTTLFLNLDIKMTPELALLLGNLALYPTTLKRKLILSLQSVHEIARHTYELTFNKPLGLRYQAGQYLEWMLLHKGTDDRGSRRYFTIASAPSDPFIKIGIRYGETISSFKTALRAMKPGATIIASQLAGDFTLPKDPSTKLAFIAGGIGITPFMSQLSEMQLSGYMHDTVLFYGNNTEAEIAYRDQLQAMSSTLPLKVVHVLAKEKIAPYETGYLNQEIIKRQAPDYSSRFWYLSGPPGMVNAYKKVLQEMGVQRRQIRCDFFPGLA